MCKLNIPKQECLTILTAAYMVIQAGFLLQGGLVIHCFHTFAHYAADNHTIQEFQHTLSAEISIEGVGIHTGENVHIVLKPAEPNTGIVFQRVDLARQTNRKSRCR